MGKRTDTISITCSRDGQAHDVPDDSMAAGQRTGQYQALCGYLVSAAALAAPIGRPCPDCTALLAAHQPAPTIGTARRSRHRQPGWLWRILHSSRNTDPGTRRLP